MRLIFTLPLLLAGACDVERDAANDTTTLEINETEAQDIAEDVGNTAENIGEAIGNAAEDAGNTIQNTDVDVSTDGGDASSNNQ
jgi:hypothetical protein